MPIKLSDTPDGHPDILQRNNAWKIFFFDETAPGMPLIMMPVFQIIWAYTISNKKYLR